MSGRKSNTFFTNLKETVRVINDAVTKISHAASEIPGECDYVQVYQDLDVKMDEIQQMKQETLNLKKELEATNSHFGNYFHDVQDLVLEIEENVDRHEKYLQKYGFEPLLIALVAEQPSTPEEQPNDENQTKKNKTPSLFDHINVGRIENLKGSGNNVQVSEAKVHKAGDGTPELIFDQSLKKSNKNKDMIADIIEKKTEDIVFEKDALPVPSVSFDANFNISGNENHLASESSYSEYQKIARRLNF